MLVCQTTHPSAQEKVTSTHNLEVSPLANGGGSLPDLVDPFPFSVDLALVTAEVVVGFLVAGNMHQFQIMDSKQQLVEVLPVHFPTVSTLYSFC